MDDLRTADVDFLTIGQYLQPTRKHHAVMRYVPPDEFAGYEKVAYTKGFLMVSASPLTRSSHHAGDDFAKLKGGAGGDLPLSVDDAEIFQQAPGSSQRATDVRSGGRCRALSRIRAVVPSLKIRQRTPQARRHRDRDRRHDGVLQAGAGILHQPGDARPPQSENHGRISARGRSAIWRTAGRSSRNPRPIAMSAFFCATNSRAGCWRC